MDKKYLARLLKLQKKPGITYAPAELFELGSQDTEFGCPYSAFRRPMSALTITTP